MNRIFYIGCFPPPYGGATVKNTVLYNELKKHMEISVFDTSCIKISSLYLYLKLSGFLFKNRNNKGIICISSLSLIKLTKLLRLFNKSILRNITVFVIGGVFHNCIEERREKPYIYNQYKNIYVESHSMKESLNKAGFNNVSVIPNFRNMPENRKFIESSSGNTLRCVFMSKICEDKGIKIIIEADKILKSKNIDYSVDFYGHVDDEIKNYFFDYIGKTSNLVYKNVIEYKNINSITDVLKNYDVLIFPTKHKGEGMAGILVEAKIAGVPPIVSAWNYNEEIITHNADGIVLKDNTPSELANAIIELSSNRELLAKLRYNAYQSGKDYIIDSYINDIVEKI